VTDKEKTRGNPLNLPRGWFLAGRNFPTRGPHPWPATRVLVGDFPYLCFVLIFLMPRCVENIKLL